MRHLKCSPYATSTKDHGSYKIRYGIHPCTFTTSFRVYGTHAPSMAPTSLPDLPPELIIYISKFIHKFKDASNLSKTSHQMHDLFNIASICKPIFPRAIDWYAQACELFAAQQEYAATNPLLAESAQAMIHRVRYLLSEAHTAQRALQFFEDAVFRPTEAKSGYSSCYGCRVLRLTERNDFTKAYCRVMTFVTSAGTSY